MPDNSVQQSFTVVIPAAGIGSRMQADRPKQYLPLFGATVIEHTARRLLTHPRIDHLVIALHPDDTEFNTLALAQSSQITTVVGGEQRADSVLNGLQAVDSSAWVLVHDAARPCIVIDDISRLLNIKDSGVGGILAKRVVDTMKRSDPQQFILHSEARDNLWHALTPQFFPCAALREALQHCKTKKLSITDEASAMEYIGESVTLVEGRSDNIKITVPEDLALAEFYLRQQEQA
ncbi:MAG: 2-C-methyl-D-erythritol 4-phosphate cytidylyltransferase [Aestuariibacter sp.]